MERLRDYGFPRPAISLAPSQQPRINQKLDMLISGYEHDGLLLDVYGTYCKVDDSYDVQEIALAGSDINIDAFLTASLTDDLNAYCERHLPTLEERTEDQRAEASIARRELRNEVLA